MNKIAAEVEATRTDIRYQPSEDVRVLYIELLYVSEMSGSSDSYRVEYLGRNGWQHWAQVLYLPMAKGIADRRADELA